MAILNNKTDVVPEQRLAHLMSTYWEFHLDEHPVKALESAQCQDIDVYFKNSIDDYERRNQCRIEFRDQLHQIEPESLVVDDQVNRQLLLRDLDSSIEKYELRAHVRPLWFPVGPEIQLSFAIKNDMLRDASDIDAYIKRLGSVPNYFDNVRDRLMSGLKQGFRVPSALRSRMLDNANGLLLDPQDESAFWYVPLMRMRGLDSGKIEQAKKRIRLQVVNRVLPALRRYSEMLEAELAKHCRESISCLNDPDGRRYYDALVRNYTTVDTAPEDIHEIGLSEVARISAEMKTLADSSAAHDNVTAMREYLRDDSRFVPDSKEDVLERSKILSKDIDRNIPEFFGVIPRTTYGIECIPQEIAAQMPPAYAQPNPMDGSRAGIYWVTSLPDRCPTYMHAPLVMHEAWPGHLMHIALLQENETLPEFRRYGYHNYESLLEGWALYCERLGVEFGLYADEYNNLGRLEMEMWRAVRLVVDTGMHIKSWSREKAIDYMRRNMVQPKAVIEAEVDRYIGMPAQALTYKVGELKISGLRKSAEEALGDDFDLRGFHDCVLSTGAVTLPILDERVNEWIAACAGNEQVSGSSI